MARRNSRRQFLQTTAATGVGFWVAGGLSAAEEKSPNERIRIACVGVAGKGSSDSSDASKHGDIVAICDIDDQKLDSASKKQGFEQAKKYNDFRKMFDELGGTIDAITVSTPDHNHAAIAVMGMRMGKHCFCQKPLTHSLYEARVMADVAREKKVATQMGNQGTANDSLRKSAAVIKSGALGAVKEVHVWTDRPIWPQGEDKLPSAPVPQHVHWDEWIGVAKYRPYANGYHPFAWRGYWDFGTGALGDMACHTVNMPFMALNLRDPVSVQAQSSGHNKDSYPGWSIIKFEFPANGGRPPVTMTWYDGGKKPDAALLDGKQPDKSGSLVIGDKGKLYAPGDYAENGFKLLGVASEPQVEFVKSPGHFEEWIRAIKGGEPAMSNFPDYAAPLTETILLGNLAVWAAPSKDEMGKKIEWDAKNLKATNAPEVDEIIRPKYREGYKL